MARRDRLDVIGLAALAIEQGWVVMQTKRGHWQFRAPLSRTLVHVSGTPSDGRGWANAAADLRRAGLSIPRKGTH